MTPNLNSLFRSYPRTSLKCKVHDESTRLLVSEGILKGTGTSPWFVAHIVSINQRIFFAKEVLSIFNTKMSEQGINCMRKITPFSVPPDPNSFVSSTISGHLVCCYSLSDQSNSWRPIPCTGNTYIPQHQSRMIWWLMTKTFLWKLFHPPSSNI